MCSANQFFDGTACQNMTVCAPGQFVQTAGTATTDRVCAACATGSYSSITNQAACVTPSDCVPGAQVITPGTSTTPYVCSPCTGGTYDDDSNWLTACVPITICQPGTHVVTNATATSDAICEACIPGFYSDSPNQTNCLAQLDCPAGTEQTFNGGTIQQSVCTPCMPGSYCPGHQYPAMTCDMGTWDDDLNPATVCVEKTTSIVVTGSSALWPADGLSGPDLVATALDANGMPVPGAVITFLSQEYTDTFTPASGSADSAGQLTSRLLATVPGVKTITASVGRVTSMPVAVDFRTADVDPANSYVTIAPSSNIAADGTTQALVRVDLGDGLGRMVANRTVSLSYSGVGTVSPASAVSDGAGVANFTVTSTTVGTGVLTATVNPNMPYELILTSQPTLNFVTPTAHLQVDIANLTGTGLKIQATGLAALTVPAGTPSVTFGSTLRSGSSYTVTIVTQPTGQFCVVTNPTGVATPPTSVVNISCARVGWKVVSSKADVTYAIAADGTLWTWYQANGIAGQVGTATWKSVSYGNGHLLAVQTNGTLWAMGNNLSGEAGVATAGAAYVTSLTQIGTATNWAQVIAADSVSYALKTDGTLWAWGYNGMYQLGDGTQTNTAVPKQVGSSTWKSISSWWGTCAVRSDGTLWTWGRNLGLVAGVTGNYVTTPTQVGTSTTWSDVSIGVWHTLALTNTGTLWTAGLDNSFGQVGYAGFAQTTLTPLSPMKTWASIAAGHHSSAAVATDGTLWTWGDNGYKQLGLGSSSAAFVTTPTQVGTATDWASASVGQYELSVLSTSGLVWTAGTQSPVLHLVTP